MPLSQRNCRISLAMLLRVAAHIQRAPFFHQKACFACILIRLGNKADFDGQNRLFLAKSRRKDVKSLRMQRCVPSMRVGALVLLFAKKSKAASAVRWPSRDLIHTEIGKDYFSLLHRGALL